MSTVPAAIQTVLSTKFGQVATSVQLMAKHRPYTGRKPYPTIKGTGLTNWALEILRCRVGIEEYAGERSSGFLAGSYEIGFRVLLENGARKWIPEELEDSCDSPMFDAITAAMESGVPNDRSANGRLIAELVSEGGGCTQLAGMAGFGQWGAGCYWEAAQWLEMWCVPEGLKRGEVRALAKQLVDEAATECGVFICEDEVFEYILEQLEEEEDAA